MDEDVVKRAIGSILERYRVDPSEQQSLTEMALQILALAKEGGHSPSELRDLVIELALEKTRSNI